MTTLVRLGISICLSLLAACSEDPMEACMKQGLGSIAGDGATRGDYVKAREKVRAECERRPN